MCVGSREGACFAPFDVCLVPRPRLGGVSCVCVCVHVYGMGGPSVKVDVVYRRSGVRRRLRGQRGEGGEANGSFREENHPVGGWLGEGYAGGGEGVVKSSCEEKEEKEEEAEEAGGGERRRRRRWGDGTGTGTGMGTERGGNGGNGKWRTAGSCVHVDCRMYCSLLSLSVCIHATYPY